MCLGPCDRGAIIGSMVTPRRRSAPVLLAGPLAEDFRREAAALNLDPVGLLATVVGRFLCAIRDGRHEIESIGRGYGREARGG
jgi:hypothetical protein